MKDRYLFTGGAPRSGTSLLHLLLQDHKDVSALPTEHTTFERFFQIAENERGNYFSGPFIKTKEGGQQSSMASEQISAKKKIRLQKEMNQSYGLDIDFSLFLDTYLKSIDSEHITIQGVLNALIEALSKSNSYFGGHHKSGNYLAFKQPFFTDLYAQDIFKEIPEAKFLYILRDPVTRYISAKERLNKQYKQKGGKSVRLNLHHQCLAHCQVSTASYYQALENERVIGKENYKILKFENLIENTEEVMRDVAQWLGLEFTDSMMSPTMLGKLAEGGSSFGKIIGLDNSILKRKINKKVVSRPELNSVYYYLNKTKLGDVYGYKNPGYFRFLLSYPVPQKTESFKQYSWRMLELFKLTKLSDILTTDFLRSARLGKVVLSGAT